MIPLRRYAGLALATWLICTASTEGTGEISLRVMPRFTIATRADVHVITRVPGDADNRELVLRWDGTESGASVRQLDGDSPVSTEWWLKNLPSGKYFIEATLIRVTGGKPRLFTDSSDVLICGPGMEECADREKRLTPAERGPED